MDEIRKAEELPEIPHATPPPIYLTRGGGAKVTEYIGKLQNYMNQLRYNHTGTQLFDIKPHSSMITLMETAKAMVRESVPIKCMEAVILAIYLTNGIPGLGRFPINFKSEVHEVSLLKGIKCAGSCLQRNVWGCGTLKKKLYYGQTSRIYFSLQHSPGFPEGIF